MRNMLSPTPDERAALLGYERLYEEWRAANDAALAAERLVDTQRPWLPGQPLPDLALDAEACELRARANAIAARTLEWVRSSPV